MASSKHYSFAQVVSDLCKILGLLTMIGGLAGAIVAFSGGKVGWQMFFLISAGSVPVGVMIVAFGQLVDAMIDTAKNTANTAKNTAVLVDLLRGERQLPVKQEPLKISDSTGGVSDQ